jgi:hypothetical protein
MKGGDAVNGGNIDVGTALEQIFNLLFITALACAQENVTVLEFYFRLVGRSSPGTEPIHFRIFPMFELFLKYQWFIITIQLIYNRVVHFLFELSESLSFNSPKDLYFIPKRSLFKLKFLML